MRSMFWSDFFLFCFVGIGFVKCFSVTQATKSLPSINSQLPMALRQEAPDNAQILSTKPLVYVVPDLLSTDECEAYINYVENLQRTQNRTMERSNPPEVSLEVTRLWPLPLLSLLAGIPPLLRLDLTTVTSGEIASNLLPPIFISFAATVALAIGVVPLVRLLSDTSSRTSDAMALNLEQDAPFIRDLVNRISFTTGHPWDCWEAPVVTRYAPGAIFARHGDASPTKGSEWSHLGGQRLVTCICYLNTVKQGGETAFDNFQVSPKQGSALVFFPASPETLEADDRTLHESLPPNEVKWIVQMFGRVGPRVPPPLGLPSLYGERETAAP